MQNWKLCETGLAESALKLEKIKARLKSPLPKKLEDLKIHKQLIKVIYFSESDDSKQTKQSVRIPDSGNFAVLIM